MAENKLFAGTSILEKALDAMTLRQTMIAQNIANFNTPKYKRLDVSFEDTLKNVINQDSVTGSRTDKRHFKINANNAKDIDIKVFVDNKRSSQRLDGNNVDVENEMAELEKTKIKYNFLAQKLSDEYKKLMTAINEGRR